MKFEITDREVEMIQSSGSVISFLKSAILAGLDNLYKKVNS